MFKLNAQFTRVSRFPNFGRVRDCNLFWYTRIKTMKSIGYITAGLQWKERTGNLNVTLIIFYTPYTIFQFGFGVFWVSKIFLSSFLLQILLYFTMYTFWSESGTSARWRTYVSPRIFRKIHGVCMNMMNEYFTTISPSTASPFILSKIFGFIIPDNIMSRPQQLCNQTQKNLLTDRDCSTADNWWLMVCCTYNWRFLDT